MTTTTNSEEKSYKGKRHKAVCHGGKGVERIWKERGRFSHASALNWVVTSPL